MGVGDRTQVASEWTVIQLCLSLRSEKGDMERGSGRGARKWAVELHDAANTSSSRDLPPDPLGFSRSTVDPVWIWVTL